MSTIKFPFLFLFFMLLLWSNVSFGQEKNLWLKLGDSRVSPSHIDNRVDADKVQNFELKMSALKYNLSKARKESVIEANLVKMEFPNDAGELVTFYIKEAPVMDDKLSNRFPNNKSYKGYGVNDPSLKIRFSVNVLGLHAMIVDKENQVQYINPADVNKSYYKIYNRRDMDPAEIDFYCAVEKSTELKTSSAALDLGTPNDLKLRTYRLALAGTGEYSQFQLDLSGIDQSTATDEEKKDVFWQQ